MSNPRSELLSEADRLVNGDRNNQYGPPTEDFTRTAAMWSAYLGMRIKAHDVAVLMALLKLSRIRWSPEKRDSWVDLAGYAACGWDCALLLDDDEADADDCTHSWRSVDGAEWCSTCRETRWSG